MLDNLEFFRVYNKKIANAINDTIQGKNKKYQLFFDSSDINIIDLRNNVFLYPKNSILDIAQNIASNPLNNPSWKVYLNNAKLVKVDVKNLTITAKYINRMVDYAYSNILDSNPMLHLPQFFLPQSNIFGLCGGIFLQILIDNGYKFHSLLIFEEDVELFSIACYFIDFKALFECVSDRSCYIFIEDIKMRSFLSHYFYSKRVTNNLLRLELSAFISPKISKIRNMVFESYKSNARGWGSFEDEIIGVRNMFKNIKSSKILKSPKKIDATICVVGSGPSLDENISFLSKNQDKMIIFSCGTALKILRKHKIKVDFQIEIERIDYLADVLCDAKLQDTPIICASVVNNEVLNIANEGYIFNRGGSASSYMTLDASIIEFCAPFVGNAGFSLACQFSDQIILCGIDCGFIKGKSKHSSDSFYGEESVELPHDVFKVRGNFDNDVYSDSIFSLSKESFELAIIKYKPHAVYNISNGAYIKGALPIKNIDLKKDINKDMISQQIKQCFSYNVRLKEDLSVKLENYIDVLKHRILNSNVSTKQELFCFIDDICQLLSKNSASNPEYGILLEGSILHLLQNLLFCLLYAKTNNITSLFSILSNEIIGCLNSFISEYKSV